MPLRPVVVFSFDVRVDGFQVPAAAYVVAHTNLGPPSIC